MQVKTIISALALSLSLAVAGPVLAQTTINGTVVSAEDLPAVQARCDEITTTPPSASDDISSDGDATDNASTPSDDTKDDSATAAADAAISTDFDLATLDAAACAQLTTK